MSLGFIASSVFNMAVVLLTSHMITQTSEIIKFTLLITLTCNFLEFSSCTFIPDCCLDVPQNRAHLIAQRNSSILCSLETRKSRMYVSDMTGADISSQGRALPWRVRVRSMICPMIMFVTASMIFDPMGISVKKATSQGKACVRSSTSV